MSTRGKVLDYSDVWRRQEIPESAKEAFSMVSPLIYDVIKKADPSERNPAQWAKRLGCWESVKSLKIEYPRAFVSWCLGEVEATSKADNRKSRHAMTNAVMTIKYIEKGKVFWSETLDSININRIAITDVERGIIQNYLAKGKVISEQQAKTLGIMYQRIGNLLAPSLVEFE
jgi:hypothetical protein